MGLCSLLGRPAQLIGGLHPNMHHRTGAMEPIWWMSSCWRLCAAL